jgi:glycosyltransferase involved in cell wall biosynthesis
VSGPGAGPAPRVLLIGHGYEGGGAQRTVRELMRGLERAGARVTTLVPDRRPSYPPNVHGFRLPGEGLLRPLVRLRGALADLRHLGSILRFARIRAGDFDVVHLHALRGRRYAAISVGAVRALARRLPLVWTVHDEWAVGRGPVADRRQLRPILPRPAAIVAPSRHMLRLAGESDLDPGVPRHLVPNGLPFADLAETQQPRETARRALGLAPGGPVVLIVAARLDDPYKGLALGLEALGRLRTPGVRVVLAGRGGSALAARAGHPVTHLGYLDDDAALARAYRAADVLLLPSRTENLPYVALEALACATPIAGFCVGGLPEIAADRGGVGPLVAPFDTGALAAAVDALLADPCRRAALGAAGRRWIETTCGVTAWIDRHLAVYREAATGRW